MKFLLILITMLFNLRFAQQQHPATTETYLNNLVLVQPDVYHLFWNYNETDIVFEVHVKQTGLTWIGFGLSRNGGMHNSVEF